MSFMWHFSRSSYLCYDSENRKHPANVVVALMHGNGVNTCMGALPGVGRCAAKDFGVITCFIYTITIIS